MKSKNLLPGICFVLLIIGVMFVCSASYQKSAAQAQLREAQQQITDLQSQLEQATNSASTDDAAEMARLRADNQDVPRMRQRIAQLEAANAKMSQQLGVIRDTALQQQDQMQQMEAQNEQAAEDQQAQAEAVQRIEIQQRNTCIANLRLIYAAKQAWALEKNKTDADIPNEQDLLPYIKGGVFPVCPSGGVYTIGAVGQPPTCSIPSHVLPQ